MLMKAQQSPFFSNISQTPALPSGHGRPSPDAPRLAPSARWVLRGRSRSGRPAARQRRWSGSGRRRLRPAHLRALTRADGRPVLHRRREAAPRHHGGPAGRAAAPAAARRGRLDLQADQGRRRGHLARGRARRLLGLRLGLGQPHLHARDPEDRRDRPSALPLGLARLVPGPHRAHPREGARRRESRPHGPALLPGRGHRQGLPPQARTAGAGSARPATGTTSSSPRAASARS